MRTWCTSTISMEERPCAETNRSSASHDFPAFYGTRKFITANTKARNLYLSWARSIKFRSSHSNSLRSILILFSHLRLGLPSGLLPTGFPIKTLYAPLLSHIRTCHMLCLFQSFWWCKACLARRRRRKTGISILVRFEFSAVRYDGTPEMVIILFIDLSGYYSWLSEFRYYRKGVGTTVSSVCIVS